MAALLLILVATIGLAVRAAVSTRRWNPTEFDAARNSELGNSGLMDTCARTLVLVLLSLLGLLALGMMYGNVLGSASANR